jgi:hypothetical protein
MYARNGTARNYTRKTKHPELTTMNMKLHINAGLMCSLFAVKSQANPKMQNAVHVCAELLSVKCLYQYLECTEKLLPWFVDILRMTFVPI